jgi:hypothetical protein
MFLAKRSSRDFYAFSSNELPDNLLNTIHIDTPGSFHLSVPLNEQGDSSVDVGFLSSLDIGVAIFKDETSRNSLKFFQKKCCKNEISTLQEQVKNLAHWIATCCFTYQ